MSVMDTLSTAIRDIQFTRYCHLASGSLIIYDHLVTLDAEVELIWKSPWSLVKALFILNRYHALTSVIINTYGLFSANLTSAFCLHFFRWQGWTGLIACMIAELILQLRLYALYSLDKRILELMVICFITSSAGSATIMGTVLSKITAVSLNVSPDITFCVPSNIYIHFFVFWIPLLAFETLLCGLALFKGFYTFRHTGLSYTSGENVVAVLIRDSVLYFLVIFASYLTNLLIWMKLPQGFLEIPIAFSVAVSCIMGSRIILNVRELSKERQSQHALTHPYHWPHDSHSNIYIGESDRPRSIVIPGAATLTDIELAQLRSMRAEP